MVRRGRLHFPHEMTRAAAYHGVSATDRRHLHGQLGSFATSAPRRAWHATSAAPGPDEAATLCLERAAVRLTVVGAPVAAAYMLLAAAGRQRGRRPARTADGARRENRASRG